jgi:hypothetical protein
MGYFFPRIASLAKRNLTTRFADLNFRAGLWIPSHAGFTIRQDKFIRSTPMSLFGVVFQLLLGDELGFLLFHVHSVVSDRFEGDRAEIQRCQGFHEHSRC